MQFMAFQVENLENLKQLRELYLGTNKKKRLWKFYYVKFLFIQSTLLRQLRQKQDHKDGGNGDLDWP